MLVKNALMTSTERATVALEEWQKQEEVWGEWKRDLRSLLTLLKLWQNILKFCISEKPCCFLPKYLLLYVWLTYTFAYITTGTSRVDTPSDLYKVEQTPYLASIKQEDFSVVFQTPKMAVTTSLAPPSLASLVLMLLLWVWFCSGNQKLRRFYWSYQPASTIKTC